jgi:hypothetical protein
MRRREFIAGVGSTLAWPSATKAQQATTPTVGVLVVGSAEAQVNVVDAFRGGLAEKRLYRR